jgi:hypothetical protein
MTTPHPDAPKSATRQHKPRPVTFHIAVNWSTSEGERGQEVTSWEVADPTDRLPAGVATSGTVPFAGDRDAARAAVRESITAAGWQIDGDITDAPVWPGMVDHPKADALCSATREGITT